MQMVKRGLVLIVTVWLALIVVMPKQELYFKLEQELQKKDIVLSGERIKERWFTLNLEAADVYVKGIKVATIENVSVFTLLFYTKVAFKGVKLDSSLRRYAPEQIDHVKIRHHLLSPQVFSVKADGDFGDAKGEVDFSHHNAKVIFSDVQKLQALRAQLKKGEEGWVYETSF